MIDEGLAEDLSRDVGRVQSIGRLRQGARELGAVKVRLVIGVALNVRRQLKLKQLIMSSFIPLEQAGEM